MAAQVPDARKGRVVTCDQHDCECVGVFRYTWPGKNEARACLEHAARLRRVATALGFHLEMISIPVEELFGEALDNEDL